MHHQGGIMLNPIAFKWRPNLSRRTLYGQEIIEICSSDPPLSSQPHEFNSWQGSFSFYLA